MRGPGASPAVPAASRCCSPRRPACRACRPQFAAACKRWLRLPERLPGSGEERGSAVAWATPCDAWKHRRPAGVNFGPRSPRRFDAGRNPVALVVELGQVGLVVRVRVAHERAPLGAEIAIHGERDFGAVLAAVRRDVVTAAVVCEARLQRPVRVELVLRVDRRADAGRTTVLRSVVVAACRIDSPRSHPSCRGARCRESRAHGACPSRPSKPPSPSMSLKR